MSNEVFNITVFEKMRNVTGSRNLVAIASFTFKFISSNQIFLKCFWFGVIHILLHTETQDSPPFPRHTPAPILISQSLIIKISSRYGFLDADSAGHKTGVWNRKFDSKYLTSALRQPSSLVPKMFGFFGDASSLTTPSPLWLHPHPKWCVKCGRPLFVKFYRQDFTKGF